jgi:hypothetical protein
VKAFEKKALGRTVDFSLKNPQNIDKIETFEVVRTPDRGAFGSPVVPLV